jgi:hypothetical protein
VGGVFVDAPSRAHPSEFLQRHNAPIIRIFLAVMLFPHMRLHGRENMRRENY